MPIKIWLLFITTTFFVSAMPGPNMLLAMTHGIHHGVKNTLTTCLGLMIGLEFGPPTGHGRARYRMIELARKGMFSQLITVPLFHRHRILTQVAADNVNIIKLLPPLIIGDGEIELFVNALDDVLGDAERSSRLLMEVGTTMARNTLRRRGRAEPAVARS